MYETPPLMRVAAQLEDEDWVTEFLPANDDRPTDLLLVSLGVELDEPVILELSFANDLAIAMGALEEFDDVIDLQFLVRFRFSYADEAIADLSRVLMVINRIVPTGAFGVSERSGTIYLIHQLYLPSREVNQDVLNTIVLGFDNFISSFLELIRSVANGDLAYAAAVSAIEEIGFQIPEMLPGPASLIEPLPGGSV